MEILFKINSKSLSKNPTSINNSLTTIQKAERTMNGTMVIDIIENKYVVTVNWNYLSNEDMKKLQAEIKSSGFCTIDYLDPESEDLKNIIAQPTGFKYAPHYDYSSDSIVWKDVSVIFTER